jgi:Family of unknown function (DUF5752)
VDKKAKEPFHFVGCAELQQSLGDRANDEKQLLEVIEQVPPDSVYYHTHSYFLRRRYIPTPYTNDFADWAGLEVRDQVLAEKLAVVDPYDFQGLEALRDELISVIDAHLSGMALVPRVIFGEPFYFKQSRIVPVHTGLAVSSLQEFRDALAEVDVSAIYYHLFEGRMRLNRREGDFSVWCREALQWPELADRLGAVNPYLGSLERIRSRLLIVLDEFLRKEDSAAQP